jgi:hypothetical protein
MDPNESGAERAGVATSVVEVCRSFPCPGPGLLVTTGQLALGCGLDRAMARAPAYFPSTSA